MVTEIWQEIKSLFRDLLWLILPKKTIDFSGQDPEVEVNPEVKRFAENVKYVILPYFFSFLINNDYGMCIYKRTTGKIMIFLNSVCLHLPYNLQRYVLFHEYWEAKLLKFPISPNQIFQRILEILQVFNENIWKLFEEIESEAINFNKKLIIFLNETDKLEKIKKEAKPEVILFSMKIIKNALEEKNPNHQLAKLLSVYLAKKELSPKAYKYFLYKNFSIE